MIGDGVRLKRRAERHAWILEWMRKNGPVDGLNAEFVEKYIAATNANEVDHMFGAATCKRLGTDLGDMHRMGLLERRATGTPEGLRSRGLPSWVYVYEIKDAESVCNEQ